MRKDREPTHPLGVLLTGKSRVCVASLAPLIEREFSAGPQVTTICAARKARRSKSVGRASCAQAMIQRASTISTASSLRSRCLRCRSPFREPWTPTVSCCWRPFPAGPRSSSSQGSRRRAAASGGTHSFPFTTRSSCRPPLPDSSVRHCSRTWRSACGQLCPPDHPEARWFTIPHPTSQRRYLVNESEVLDRVRLLLGRVTVIDAGSMSVSEQGNAVQDARVIIGPHGAQLTNLVWAPRVEPMIELLPYPRLVDYRSLAAVRNVAWFAVPEDAFNDPDHNLPFHWDASAVADAFIATSRRSYSTEELFRVELDDPWCR